MPCLAPCLGFVCAVPPESLAFPQGPRLKRPMSDSLHHKPDNSRPVDANALLARVGRNRDRAAFVELFHYYAPRVKSYLLRNGADDSAAEEIVQNTFITVWEKAKTYDPAKAAASTWIFTVARNKRIDALRREKFVTFDTDSLANTAAETAENYADGVEAGSLDAAIDKLPEEQAKLLRMAFFEDKSHSAIAKETHLPLGTVKSRLRLALEKLRDALKGDEE
jgi:RNA polymerase sigma factor (sigma-70 family)